MMKNNKLTLLPHQEEAMKRIRKNPFYFLFMEQGTGKTPVAIQDIFELYHKGVKRVIIFAPKTLLYNWTLEINRFLDVKGYVIETLEQSTKNARNEAARRFVDLDAPLKILVVNYEKANIIRNWLVKFEAQLGIIDESHKVRNRNSGISKNIMITLRDCDYRLLMTGTPICNGYEDLFMQYRICDHTIFGPNWKEFSQRYIKYGGYEGREIVGYYHTDELDFMLKDTSYRVKISDCIKLPPISKVYIPVELPSKAKKVYEQIKKEMISELGEYSRKDLKHICKAHKIAYNKTESYMSLLVKARPYLNLVSCEITLTKMLRLHQICGGFVNDDLGDSIYLGSDKPKKVIEILEDSDGPVVIFCQYVSEIDHLDEILTLKGYKVGNYRHKSHRKVVYKDFQEDKLDVIILQLKSGSVGLNLQNASKLIMYSWNFSADDYVQAMARIIRSGQKNRMTIYHLVAKGYIDDDILKAIKRKRKLADDLLDK